MRMYTVQFDNVSVSAIQDLFELTPAANKAIELVAMHFSQTGVADVGDAAEEMLAVQVIRGYTSSGSGGSTVTPSVVKPADTAAGFTCEANNTTVASTGTAVILDTRNFNVRAGLDYIWPPGMEHGANAGHTTMCVRLVRAPADAITLSGTAYVREIG
jgi:hypothetical protein